MLTTLAAWQRASLRPWLALGRNACAALEPAGLLTALADLALLNLATGEARAQDLAAAVARDTGRPLRSEVILDHPFAATRALRPSDTPARRRILLAAPYSGYATTVLSGLVAALVQEAEVLVTDWRDAREVPLAAGRFELADQIALLATLMRRQGPALHVVALSQASVPALLARRRRRRGTGRGACEPQPARRADRPAPQPDRRQPAVPGRAAAGARGGLVAQGRPGPCGRRP